MKAYLVVIEWAGSSFSAYVPDLPGCITTGPTIEQTERNIREAMALYIDTSWEDGLPVPQPVTQARTVAIAA
jgi:predicted RNase H-like HicB family nuclease